MDTKQKNELNELLTSITESQDYSVAYNYYLKALSILNEAFYQNSERKKHGSRVPNYWVGAPGNPNKYVEWVIGSEKDPNPSSVQVFLPSFPLGSQIYYGGNLPPNSLPLDFEMRFDLLSKLVTENMNLQKKNLEQIENLQTDLNSIRRENIALKDVNFNLSTQFLNDAKIQFIPVEIYLDTNDPHISFNVYSSILDFLKAIGFEKSFEFDAIKGSWFKRMLAKSQKALTSQEVLDRLKEIEYGVEVNTILKQQSEIDKNQSEALLNILNSVEKVPNAAIRIGALLVVKVTNNEGAVNVQVRTLSIKELHLLNKKPELLHNPQQVLIALTEELEDDNSKNSSI